MILRELFKSKKPSLAEGGNLSSQSPGWQGAQDVAADEIDLKVHNRSFMVGLMDKLLHDIDNSFQSTHKKPLWSKQLLQSKQFLGGSSLHFFNTTGISDQEFAQHKPKVGDIDTQCNKELEPEIEQFLNSINGKRVGDAVFLGFSRGNEQLNGLFQFDNPPIKIQIDFEFGRYAPETNAPDDWYRFSHSSAWNDIQAGIKGVMHKYLYRSLAKAGPTTKYIAKLEGRGKARAMTISQEPITDANFSFAVASGEGGGVRAKYKPYIDPATGVEKVINGIPVMEPVAPADSEYIQNLSKQFELFFNHPPENGELESQQSFLGTLDLMNKYLDDAAKQNAFNEFLTIVFEPGAQMITAADPVRDRDVKFAAIDSMIEKLGLGSLRANAVQMAKAYEQDYHDLEAFKKANPGVAQPRAAMKKMKAQPVNEAGEVKAQFRKNMPHLRDLKSIDFLDLLDEIHDGNGSFKLQNIPLNVKVDGFGGRFGKDAEGKPFMATSNTPPRYAPGFVKYHQDKGTTDPEILGRAQLFDQLFVEMMNAIKLVDGKFGPDFLIDKQVTCEVLFIPFATETPEGKLKFVGIHYDKLPEGVQLALVPFRVVNATSGEDLPDAQEIVKQLTSVGQDGSVMFIDNSLTQKEGLDVTALVPPMENLEQFKSMLADPSAGSLKRKQEVAAALEPVKLALEKAISEDPNILGKELLGKDYEGIVINSRLGPIKVTSQTQRDVIAAKNAAKASARAERPRENANKTAVVAIGSFAGHIGHQELFKFTIDKAGAVGGDPYLFIGNAEGKDDPIPIADKVKTWHMLYPQYAKNISAVTHDGGSIIQKIKHELINPLPGKPPRYDNVIIMVGADRAGINMPAALMKAVNKFQGYEHVKVSLEPTPRGTGVSFTQLRNDLKTKTPEQAFAAWSNAFNTGKSGAQPLPPDWIKHLMDVSRTGMGLQQPQQPAPQAPAKQKPAQQTAPQTEPVAEQRLFNALVRPKTAAYQLDEFDLFKKGLPMKEPAKKPAASSAEMRKFFQAQANKEKPGLKPKSIDIDHPQRVYVRHADEEMENSSDAMSRMARDLTGPGAPDAKRRAQRDQQRQQDRAQSDGRDHGPKWDVEEGYPNQQISRYNPNGTTYRGSYNKMPTLDPNDPVHQADRYGPEHDEPYEMDVDKEDLKRAIAKGMLDLSDRAKHILELRFWDNMTYDEIASELGVSRERIRQIEAKALRQLKHPSRSDRLRPFVQVAEAPKSAAVRLGNAIQRVQGKTAASQARSVIPSSIPKPEPKPQDKKVSEKLKTGPAAHFTPKDAHVKRGQFVGGEGMEEGLGNWARGAALAGAMALGGGAHAADDNANAGWHNLPDIVAHITMKVNGKTIEKEINLGTEYQSPMEAQKAVAKWLKEKGITNYTIDLERVKSTNEEKQRLDPSCWKGYRKAGTKMKGNTRVNNCVKVSEDVENLMDVLINKIIVNEAIQNNKR